MLGFFDRGFVSRNDFSSEPRKIVFKLDKVSWGADAFRGPSGRCGCREPGAIAQGFARANREWSLGKWKRRIGARVAARPGPRLRCLPAKTGHPRPVGTTASEGKCGTAYQRGLPQ